MTSISLTKGQVAFVDDDCAVLCGEKWRAQYALSTGTFYAVRGMRRADGKRYARYLHRAVMELALGRDLARGELVDHINHDTLDCRAGNLRVATASQNQSNKRSARSGLKGVTWHSRDRKWQAAIVAEGKTFHLGYFDDAKEAALVYDGAAMLLHREFACLNFPGTSQP